MAVILAIDLGKYNATARRYVGPPRTVADDREPPDKFSQLQFLYRRVLSLGKNLAPG